MISTTKEGTTVWFALVQTNGEKYPTHKISVSLEYMLALLKTSPTEREFRAQLFRDGSLSTLTSAELSDIHICETNKERTESSLRTRAVRQGF